MSKLQTIVEDSDTLGATAKAVLPALTALVTGLCVGCGSNDPSRMDYSGSIAMNILIVLVVAFLFAVGWLVNKISGDDKTKQKPARARQDPAGKEKEQLEKRDDVKIEFGERGEITSLRFFQRSYSNFRITDAELVLLKGLTSLQDLLLPGAQITDAGLVHLQGLTSLERLVLDSNTQITDAGLVHLQGLTSLERLSLHNTQITDAGLVHLKGLTSLQGLSLGKSLITGLGLVHLQGLTSLRTLYLHNTQITDAGAAKLREVLPDCSVSH